MFTNLAIVCGPHFVLYIFSYKVQPHGMPPRYFLLPKSAESGINTPKSADSLIIKLGVRRLDLTRMQVKTAGTSTWIIWCTPEIWIFAESGGFETQQAV